MGYKLRKRVTGVCVCVCVCVKRNATGNEQKGVCVRACVQMCVRTCVCACACVAHDAMGEGAVRLSNNTWAVYPTVHMPSNSQTQTVLVNLWELNPCNQVLYLWITIKLSSHCRLTPETPYKVHFKRNRIALSMS